MNCEDGEVVGVDTNGEIIQYNADEDCFYSCGETPDQFGWDNLWSHEYERVINSDFYWGII